MTNFAARLVARAVGRASGSSLAVLTPRPISRFEPSATIDTQAAAESAQADPTFGAEAVAAARIPAQQAEQRASHNNGVSTLATLQATMRLSDNDEISAAAGASSPDVPTLDLPSYHARSQQQLPFPAGDETLPKSGQPAKTARSVMSPLPEVAGASINSSVEDDLTGLCPPASVAEQDARIDLVHPAHNPVSSISPSRDWVTPPPASAVSIGTIEVQFLPQEPRVLSPRPQPQKTRGFDAYARARRGQPR